MVGHGRAADVGTVPMTRPSVRAPTHDRLVHVWYVGGIVQCERRTPGQDGFRISIKGDLQSVDGVAPTCLRCIALAACACA